MAGMSLDLRTLSLPVQQYLLNRLIIPSDCQSPIGFIGYWGYSWDKRVKIKTFVTEDENFYINEMVTLVVGWFSFSQRMLNRNVKFELHRAYDLKQVPVVRFSVSKKRSWNYKLKPTWRYFLQVGKIISISDLSLYTFNAISIISRFNKYNLTLLGGLFP